MKINELLAEGTISNLLQKFNEWKNRRAEQHIQSVWDKKTDEDIRTAYKDATEWLSVLSHKTMDDTPKLDGMRKSIHERLNKHILPQMKKRGMKINT